MQDWLSARVQSRPDGIAVIADDQQITYAELDQRVQNYAENLLLHGVQKRDRAAILLANRVEYVVLIHALMRLQAILVPLNTRHTTDEIEWQLKQTDCRFLITSASQQENIQDLAQDNCKIILVENLESTTNRQSPVDAPPNVELDAPLAIVFTSGTSGKPKGATLTYGNFFYSAMASAYRLGTLPNDRCLCVLPLYHVGGLSIVIRCCLYGTTIVLQNGFDMDTFHHAMIAHQITLASLVPTILYRLIERFGRDFMPDSLRMILLGGAAASPELIRMCHELDIPVATTYGLTEAASQVATAAPDDVRRKPGTVGKPLMFTSVRIADEDGYSLPVGEYGEIVISGETAMQGYFNDADASASTLRDGELYTDDIGYLDEDGDLWVVQRRSDLIVTGGENVYPAEVERILKQHPAVKEVCVVGVDHPEWGQQVTAMVIVQDEQSLSSEELIAYSRQYLAGYKQPRLVQFVDQFPQTASGKIHRQSVQQLMSRFIENSNA